MVLVRNDVMKFIDGHFDDLQMNKLYTAINGPGSHVLICKRRSISRLFLEILDICFKFWCLIVNPLLCQ